MYQNDHRLWYRESAKNFNEALPLGNGRMGAMVYGGVREEKLNLNEETLWAGRPRQSEKACADVWQEAQALSRAGRFKEAQALLESRFGDFLIQPYLPLGDLEIRMAHGEAAENYRRELNLIDACHRTSYACAGVQYDRECFVSAADQVLAMSLTARGGRVSFSLALKNALKAVVTAQGNEVTLLGRCPDRVYDETGSYYVYEGQNVGYCAAARVLTVGGSVHAQEGYLAVTDAEEAVILLAIRTDFVDAFTTPGGADVVALCRADLDAAEKKGYAALKEAHIADHQAMYGRCWLHLGESGESALPTDERMKRHEEGRHDLSLYALLFHYGRYLTLGCSRPGCQPSNLQGIWNDKLLPPWCSNYTMNINTEMNYWPVLAANLSECYEPLLRLAGELRRAGRETAQNYYGAPGFCSHHATDLWRSVHPGTAFVKNSCQWGEWPLSSAWISAMAWDAYRYSADEALLQELTPLLKDCADFYCALLEEKGGFLIFCPSTSPENNYEKDGEACPLDYTTTMTTALIREVLGCLIEALDMQGRNAEPYRTVRAKLRPYTLNPDGTLNEWYDCHEDWDRHHRHVSHLYGLFPGTQIDERTPELMEACRKSLEKRGDASTGWSLAWKINLWARLRDGNRAQRLIDTQLIMVDSAQEDITYHGGTYPNLFCAHPPFQIDGNFGACSGILQMLVQKNAAGETVLLPALPDEWQAGELHGVRLPDGEEISFRWANGRVIEE